MSDDDAVNDNGCGPVPIGAYVHVPFCHHRCNYCNFTVVANRSDLVEAYLEAISIELRSLRTPRVVKTIFLGGGTPSMLDEPSTHRLLSMIGEWLQVDSSGEFTIESNPSDLSEEKLKLFREYGINRVSIGGQSFQSEKLRSLQRDHSPKQLIEAIERSAQIVGNVSLDLIFAAPDESLAEWEEDLKQALALPLKHLSTYGLTYEKGARLWSQLQQGEVQRVDEDSELAMYLATIERLHQAGWEHYEVSNFAKPGFRSRHNEIYWTDQRWWAFGPGAARFINRTRSTNHRSTTEYIKRMRRGDSPIAESDELSDAQLLIDRLVFGLRRLEGIKWGKVIATCDDEILIEKLTKARDHHIVTGWLQLADGVLRLTRSGLVVSDGLWPDYLEHGSKAL